MAEGKKYGAFAGVFTPSLLTILGVIMYMRLGWVVGQAGLIYTIVIILISHVISVTTGLSISSIATDKKIKTGGIYYILSRSLGLPMGGAIGIALFIGTALSISLYIVGFAESFLNIEAIQNFLNLQPDIHGYRIVGTAIIIFLVIIAFISTSLALKMQFFILVAIALSLISIAVGFFTHTEFHPEHAVLFSSGDVSIETIFAIFFPAVTGFTAGVAMSGDLKDPKKDIPKGTILAILTGFIVYVSLAVGIAFFIDRDFLVSDYNILSKIAWFAPLVIAGIWGATLSSALGGILGGPRILQAISQDKITPAVFGKGYGSTNEPRNALLLIFAIAEGGILIGKLDVIAGVVSMFYLASYGFINLAYVLEKWASTDFRPSFNVHISIGIIGFIASFAVMFKLDMLSMIASLIIIGAIYFYLKRKELKTETGDVWHSVWTSVTRRALTAMNKRPIEERNWKPNIILFSGGTKQRPHLLEMGKAIVGRHGILSNFDLIENKESKLLFTKIQQRINDEQEIPGVFTRRQTCNDIYEGIEMIARTYGFAGVEPNTIMMGWGRQSKNPERFVKLINTLNELDYNIIMLDYDKRFGFGKKQQIDIWWRGAGNHGNLALTLSKFILTDNEWSHASIRLLIVNYDNDKASLIRQKAETYLENLRIDAQVKIINNEIEQKPFYDLMRVESKSADLVILGFPEIQKGKEQEFIDKTNTLLKDIGTVMLIKASSVFKELNLGVSHNAPNKELKIKSVIQEDNNIELQPAKNEIINSYFKDTLNNIHKIYQNDIKSAVIKELNDNEQLITKCFELANAGFDNIKLKFDKFEKSRKFKLIIQSRTSFLIKTNKEIQAYINLINEQKELLADKLNAYQNEIDKLFSEEISKKLQIVYSKQDLNITKQDSLRLKWFKLRKKLFAGSKGVKYNIKLRTIVNQEFTPKRHLFFYNHLKSFGLINAQFIIELQKMLSKIDNEFKYLILQLESEKYDDKIDFDIAKNNIKKYYDNIVEFNNNIQKDLQAEHCNFYTNNFNKTISLLNEVHPNRHIKESKSFKKIISRLNKKISSVPEYWAENQLYLFNATSFELRLSATSAMIKTSLKDSVEKLKRYTETNLLEKYIELQEIVNKGIKQGDNIPSTIEISELNSYFGIEKEHINHNLQKLINGFPEKLSVFAPDDLNEFKETQFENILPTKISASQLLEYIIQQEIIVVWNEFLDESKTKINESVNKINNSIRLLSFLVSQKTEHANIEEWNKNIEEQRIIINTEVHFLKEIIQEIENKHLSIFSNSSQNLEYYAFIKTASNLKQYIKKDEQKGIKKHGLPVVNKLRNRLIDYYTYLLYAGNKALSIKDELNSGKLKSSSELILDLLEQLSPKSEVYNALPFYYKQLFENNKSHHKEFWYGRNKELSQINKAFERYQHGYKGAIAVIGEPGSGKTFFADFATHNFGFTNIFTVTPPIEGSLKLKDFEFALQEATEMQLPLNSIFDKLEKNSVFIIDDIELWWEKTPEGNKLLKQIFDIVRKYHKKHIFILNINTYVAKSIFLQNSVDELFINFVHLSKLDAKTLQNIVITRHSAGGLKLNYHKKDLQHIGKVKLARLFVKYFNISDGNIASALHLWIGSIYKYQNKTVYIKDPEANYLLLANINTDNLIVLAQFVLHKNITVKKLMRILHETKPAIDERIDFLLRSGLIQANENIYHINTYLQSLIIKQLINRQLL